MFRHVVEAPATYENLQGLRLFLAGGITGVSDWQKEAIGMLHDPLAESGVIFNPRRARYTMDGDVALAREQINWEYEALLASDIILFWFPMGQTQPIALFELGRWSHPRLENNIVVGTHPDYFRRLDVEVQLENSRPGLKVHTSLEETVAEAKRLVNTYKWEAEGSAV